MNKNSYLEFLANVELWTNSVLSGLGDKTVQEITENLKNAWIMGYQTAVKDFGSSVVVKVEEKNERTYEPVEPETTEDEEKEPQIPGVIIITDEIKKEYPELKNLQMIQKEPSDYMTWNDSMQYAKDLDLGGFNDWRLPTMEELRGIYRAKQALGIPADYHWYWSGSEAGASYAWTVYFNSSGRVYIHYKGYSYYARCVR